jgi:hypothetical protein
METISFAKMCATLLERVFGALNFEKGIQIYGCPKSRKGSNDV